MPPAIMGLLPIISGVASAGASAVKYIGDQNQAAKDRTLASETQRYSPWTGLQAKAPHDPNLGEAIGGGLAGALATGQTVAKTVGGLPSGDSGFSMSEGRAADGSPSLGNFSSDGAYGSGMSPWGLTAKEDNMQLPGLDSQPSGAPPSLFNAPTKNMFAAGRQKLINPNS